MVNTYVLSIGLVNGYNKKLFLTPEGCERVLDIVSDFCEKMIIDLRDQQWIAASVNLMERYGSPNFNKHLEDAKKSKDWQLIEQYTLKNQKSSNN